MIHKHAAPAVSGIIDRRVLGLTLGITGTPRSRPAIWNDDRLGAFDEDECGLADEGDTGRT